MEAGRLGFALGRDLTCCQGALAPRPRLLRDRGTDDRAAGWRLQVGKADGIRGGISWPADGPDVTVRIGLLQHL